MDVPFSPRRAAVAASISAVLVLVALTLAARSLLAPTSLPSSADTLPLARASVPPFGTPDEMLGPEVASDGAFVTFVLVPVGSSQEETVWTSADGSTWTRATRPGALGSPGSTVLDAVADGAGGFIAVGLQPSNGSGSRAAAWRSTDGRTWRAATLDGTPGEDLSTVAEHETTFVAVAGKPRGARLWFSADGEQWQPVSGVDAGAGALDVFSWQDGFVLVASTDATSHRVWTSTDGKTWSEQTDWHLPDGFGTAMGLDGGLVAPVPVAGSTGKQPRTGWWWSADGQGWDQTMEPTTGILGWGVVDGRLLVVRQPDGAATASVLVTADGRSWFSLQGTGLRLESGGSARLAAIGNRVAILGGLDHHSAWYGDLAVAAP
jgi:hypothetical protein